MTLQEINKSDFEQLLMNEGKIVLDFAADWCPPCKVMHPILEALSKDESLSSLKFVTIDVDHEPELQGQFKIMSIPTFIFLKTSGDGKYEEMDRMVGQQDPLSFKAALTQFAQS